jgi:hypothetical protein
MFDRDIPIPTIVPRNNKYNFHKMETGQSFDIAFDPEDVQRLRVAACNYGRRNDKTFVTRKVEQNGESLLRVWRQT